MQRDPDKQTMEKAYARWAPVYDVLCGPVFVNGRRAAARAARDVGGRILEIGVGTGLSFDDYDAATEITGIDISEPMIARARLRAASGRYPFVKGLAVMDAHQLRYDDASFDCAVGQFVITLVANPERVLSECARVVRPGGQIILVNHLYSERGLAAAVERLLAERARLAARISVRAAGGVGADARRGRAGRTAQGSAVRRLYAGAVPPLRAAKRRRVERDPEKACPGLDPGWEPVFGKVNAQGKHVQTVKAAVIKPRREFAMRLAMINGRKLAAS
jgi:ubiquinone/menaquinone biosynthesis C-methylase UbiE